MALDKMIFLACVLLLATANATPVMRRDTASASTGQCAPLTAQNLSELLLGLEGNATSFEPHFSSVNTGTGTAVRPCPLNTGIVSSMAVNERAVCPWDYEQREYPSLIPRIINRAVHRCNGTGKCIDPRTGGEISDANCEPINYRMKVLNRTECADGNYTYRVEYLQVPVAFTCSRPVTRP
ncbi:uncharacterized protein LOC119727124 [Patiria miniata]|uniref:Uncharacterized protein n=1 Tax=Patiria miniata TaxID=46514 RepID=A0A913ZT32_PATMI|nr:uncharacterized protein LOC119727124 [Patiria miniata]